MQSVCGHPLGGLGFSGSARNEVGTDVECRGLDPAADLPERLRSLSRVPECFDCDEPGRGKCASQPTEVDIDPAVNLCSGSIAGKVVVRFHGDEHNVRLRHNYYIRFVDGGRAVGNRQRTRQSARLRQHLIRARSLLAPVLPPFEVTTRAVVSASTTTIAASVIRVPPVMGVVRGDARWCWGSFALRRCRGRFNSSLSASVRFNSKFLGIRGAK